MNSQVSVATYMYDKATCSVYNREILVVIDLILQILFGLGDRLNFVIWKELYLLARLSLELTNLIITEYGSLTTAYTIFISTLQCTVGDAFYTRTSKQPISLMGSP